jgi:hypothetical protein
MKTQCFFIERTIFLVKRIIARLENASTTVQAIAAMVAFIVPKAIEIPLDYYCLKPFFYAHPVGTELFFWSALGGISVWFAVYAISVFSDDVKKLFHVA